MTLIVCSIALCQAAQAPRSSAPDVRCGSHALYIALRALGLNSDSFSSLEGSLGPPGPNGYSMLQLEDEARKRGARTLAVKTTLDNLRHRKRPFACIALLLNQHFVLIYDVDDRIVHLVDGRESKLIPRDTFLGVWTGNALLVGPSDFTSEEEIERIHAMKSWALRGLGVAVLAAALILVASMIAKRLGSRLPAALVVLGVTFAASGCGHGTASTSIAQSRQAGATPARIRVDTAHHDLGRIPLESISSEIDVSTIITNVGGEALRISEITTSCVCTTVNIESVLIPPGKSSRLTTRIKLGYSPEVRQTGLIIRSSDPIEPSTNVSFQWQVISSLRTSPATCFWSKVLPGETVSQELRVFVKGLSLCPDCRVRILPDSSAVRCIFVPSGHARQANHQLRAELIGKDVEVGQVTINVEADDDPKEHRQTAFLFVQCGSEERGRLEIPIHWAVRPFLIAIPRRLSLGNVKPGQQVGQRIVLKSGDRTRFRVTNLSLDTYSFVSKSYESESLAEHVIDVKVTVPAMRGVVRRMLRLETDHPACPVVELPISSMIDDAG